MSDQLFQLIVSQAWQIAVLAILVAIVTRTVAKNRPHLAHAMWLLVLIKCVTPPIWGHSLGLFSRLQAAISTEQSPAASDATYEDIPQAAEPTSSLVRPSLEPEFHITGNMASDEATTPGVPTTESPPATVPAVDMSKVTATKSLEGIRRPSYSWPAILLFCVAAGAFVTLSLMIVRCVQCLRSIHRHRTTEFDAMLIERVHDLSHKLRLRRAPRVIVSDVLFGPAVLGLWRHAIVLPRCLLSDGRSFLPERTFAEGEPARRTMDNAGLPEGTECAQVAASREVLPGRQDLLFLDPILAHELLHIRRGDLRTGTLQAIVQSLWWFHPAVWLCNRWLSREAERCCDEQVIAELGCSPAQYARSLLSVIESKHQLQPVPVFPGMKPVEITSQRMERIMSLKTGLQKQTPLWCWLAVTVLAVVVLPGAIAKPQSEENVVEAQPQEMALPQETKVADVPEVEVSTKTYIVGDLIERLAKEQNLSLDQARKSLLQIFESSVVPVHRHVQGAPAPPVNLPQPSPPADSSPRVVSIAGAVSSPSTEIVVLSSYAIDGDRVVVVQSAAGHATLQQYIDAVRQHGFTTFQVTARYIIGPPEEINSLMEALQQEKPFPKAAEGETVAKSSQFEKQAPQSATTLCVGTTGIVSFEESRKIEELARSKADCLSIQCPKVSAINGQVATIQTGETKPFIVGFKENDEPMIRTVVEGLTLRVTPKVVDKGLFQLKSVACLEGTSEQRLITTTGRVTETPKMFTLPAITIKQVQTTVELQENQALLQSGMITTEEGKSRAFLAVLEAQLIAPEVAAKAAEVDYSIGEPSAIGFAEINPADKTNTPKEIEQSANPTVRVAWEARETVRRRLLSTDHYTPWQIMSGIEGLRRDMLLKDGPKTVNALEWIQEGPSFRGESWFEKTKHGGRAHPFSKPYWFEGHINQFFSKLAACRLPLDTQFGTPDGPITIQDMIDHAKMVVNDREAVSWTILALCRYLPPDAKWTNAKGEEWSIERLVDIEVGKQVGGPTSPNGGTDLLYALAVARNEYLKTGKPLEGVWLKADEKIRMYIDVAKSQQNPDGTLSSYFFRGGDRTEDFIGRLASSGHLLQFLMHAVSDEQLKEDLIHRAVDATANDIQMHANDILMRERRFVAFFSRDPLFTATEALTTYLERVTKTSIGCAPQSPKSEERSVQSLNSLTEHSPKVPVVSGVTSRDDRLVMMAYNVPDLIAQFKTTDAEMSFSPLVELIKTSIEPESWENGSGVIFADKKTICLVIRQTQTGHDGIAKILSQLRKSYDSVKVTCRLIKLTADSQLKGLEDKCSLHSLSEDQRWALLTKSRSEALQKFLADEKAEVLSCPTIVTISGQPALVQVASTDGAALTGFQLSANPHLIADSSVIRLSHSVTVGELAKDAQAAVHESLVGSGQTLLLVIEQPGKVDGRPDRYVVMLTPEHVKEEEVILPR